jgi:hypothetical protein
VPFSNVDECSLARNHIHPSGMEVPEPMQMEVKSLAQRLSPWHSSHIDAWQLVMRIARIKVCKSMFQVLSAR